MKESKHIEINEAKWDKWAATVDSKNWMYDMLRKQQSNLISLLEIKENMNFLDIGCGTGNALGLVAKRINGKGSFYGVDLSAKMIEKAKENFKEHSNFHFIKANAESIPLDDNLFDVIICTNSFHHYFNPDKVMKEIYRLLKAGGKIYILDPTIDSWFMKILSKLVHLFESEHVKFYSTKEFKKLIIDAGLKYGDREKINAHKRVHIGEK